MNNLENQGGNKSGINWYVESMKNNRNDANYAR